MALDPNLALRLQPMQVRPQANALAEMLQLQGSMRQNELSGLQLGETKQKIQQEQAWRGGLGMHDPSTPEGLSALMRLDPSRAAAIQKAQLEAQRLQSGIKKDDAATGESLAGTEKKRADMKRAQLGDYLQKLAGVRDPQSAQAWVNGGVTAGLMSMQEAQRELQAVPQDPQALEQWKRAKMMEGMELGKQFDVQHQDRTHGLALNQFGELVANNKRVDQRIRSEGAANRGVQVRGQNMTDKRARESADIQRTAGRSQVMETADGVMIIDKGTGLARPAATMNGAPLAGKDHALTEGQSKALAFGERMAGHNKTLATLESGGVSNRGAVKAAAENAGRVIGLGTDGMGGTLADIAGTATNWTQSSEQQQYEAAKRNWIAAALRKESGAAIGVGEYRDADNQYFPQPNDSAETKQQKAALRDSATRLMLAEVPQRARDKFTGQGSQPKPAAAGPIRFDANGNRIP